MEQMSVSDLSLLPHTIIAEYPYATRGDGTLMR